MAPNRSPTITRRHTQEFDFDTFDPKDDKLVQQLLGAAHLAMSDRDAVLGKAELDFGAATTARRKGSQESRPRNESLDYMKMR